MEIHQDVTEHIKNICFDKWTDWKNPIVFERKKYYDAKGRTKIIIEYYQKSLFQDFYDFVAKVIIGDNQLFHCWRNQKGYEILGKNSQMSKMKNFSTTIQPLVTVDNYGIQLQKENHLFIFFSSFIKLALIGISNVRLNGFVIFS